MNKKVIERILKNLLINETYTIEKEESEILLNYIADLQRKEYNNSKAIEYIKIYEKDFDNYNLKVLKGILKGVVIPVFENKKGE